MKPFLVFILVTGFLNSPTYGMGKDPLQGDEVDPFSKLDGSPKLSLSDPKELLRFKKWDPLYLKYLEQSLIFLPDWKDRLTLPDPPANSSERVEAEIDYLISLQQKRTASTVENIKQELDWKSCFDLGIWLGKDYSWKNYPVTERLIINVMNDATVITIHLKKKYERPRPSELDSRISPCIEVPGHSSYPSGHSTKAYLCALIMKELKPNSADVLQEVASRIAWDREAAGVHYPSDTSVGEFLSRQMFNALMTKKTFQLNLEKARKEWLKDQR